MSPTEKTEPRTPSGSSSETPTPAGEQAAPTSATSAQRATRPTARPTAQSPAQTSQQAGRPQTRTPGAPRAAPSGAAGGREPGGAATPGRAAPASASRPAARPGVAASTRPARPGDASRPPSHSDQQTSPPAGGEAPRRVRLSLSRVDLWSVARLAFLLSVALGIIAVVAVAVLWAILDGMGVFTQLDSVVRDVVGTESDFRVADVFGLSRVLSVTVFLALVDVVLVTLVATIGALLYNLAGGLVGGVRLTLSDD